MIITYIKVICNNCDYEDGFEWEDITSSPDGLVINWCKDNDWYYEPGGYHTCPDCKTYTCNCDCPCDADVDYEDTLCGHCEDACNNTCSCDCGCEEHVSEDGLICGSCEATCNDDEEEDDGYVCCCDCGCDNAVDDENIRCEDCIRLGEEDNTTHHLVNRY